MVGLLGAGVNITCTGVEKDASGAVVGLTASVDLARANKPKGHLHWVDASEAGAGHECAATDDGSGRQEGDGGEAAAAVEGGGGDGEGGGGYGDGGYVLGYEEAFVVHLGGRHGGGGTNLFTNILKNYL